MTLRLPAGLVALTTVTSALAIVATAVGADVAVQGESLTLVDALGSVSAQAPDLMYVVYAGDADTRRLDLTCRTADEAIDRLLSEYGVEGSVVGDLWVIRGAPTSVRITDAKSAIVESLPLDDALRRTLEGFGVREPRAAADIVAEIVCSRCQGRLAAEAPVGALDACGVTLAHGDPLAVELIASLVESTSAREPSAMRHEEWLRSSARLTAVGKTLSVVPPGGPALWGPHDAADPSPDGPHGLASFGPDARPWSARWRLSAPVSLAASGALGDLAGDIGAQARLRVGVPSGLAGLPVSVHVDRLAAGTALVALSVAVGAPIHTAEACLSVELGAGAFATKAYSAYGIDALLAAYTRDTAPIHEAAQAFTDDEWSLLRGDGVALGQLSPQLRHALLRALAEDGGEPSSVVDRLIARHIAHADVHLLAILIGGVGDVEVRVMTGKGPMRTFTYHKEVAGDGCRLVAYDARGVGQPNTGLEGPARRIRLRPPITHGARPPAERGPDGKGVVVHAGPITAPPGGLGGMRTD